MGQLNKEHNTFIIQSKHYMTSHPQNTNTHTYIHTQIEYWYEIIFLKDLQNINV